MDAITEDRANLMINAALTSYDRELHEKLERRRQEDRTEVLRLHRENRGDSQEIKGELKQVATNLDAIRGPFQQQSAVRADRAWLFALGISALGALAEILRAVIH